MAPCPRSGPVADAVVGSGSDAVTRTISRDATTAMANPATAARSRLNGLI